MSRIDRFLLGPTPLRSLYLQLLKRFKARDAEFFLNNYSVERPHYAHILYEGARLARRLGLDRVSAIEFGVAGGNGLVAMERHAAQIEKMVGVRIDIYGFDTGEGLPAPQDYRDLPYHWKQGFYKMDREALLSRLERSKVLFGDVKDTIGDFAGRHNPAPIAAIAHDFDYYSSTMSALKLFDADKRFLLPRIFCYFDDTIGSEIELYNDYTGQRAAIADFNASHAEQKLTKPYYFEAKLVKPPWVSQIFIYHDFRHPLYDKFVSDEDQQNPLQGR